uniref:T9SS type A sorting domain-containing protein n=1 Tax=Winogradskyella sp. TaxID=1883156 RepID=UPI0026131E5B
NQSGVWTQIGQDIDGEAADDQSGFSLSLSSDGSILAIGAPFNDGNVLSSGHVRVYENQSGVWTQIGQDIDGELGDTSGSSLSLSSDGTILAVGATNNGDNGLNSGQVKIYENINNVWMQIGQDINGESSSDQSGFSLSLSSDGSILAIGAPFNDGNGDSSGHVRVYENQSGVWTQIGQDIDGEAAFDQSGTRISLSSDGSILAVGAPSNDGNGNDSGHVRVYENQSGVWTQIGQDIDGEAAGDSFGRNLDLSSDGSILAIGAPFNNDNGSSSGQVKVYMNINNTWMQIGSDINGESSPNLFGISIKLSSDGSILAVGAPFNDGNGNRSGHVRVFDLSALLSLEEQNELVFGIFPNPTKDQFTIQLDNSSDLLNIHIYNNLGQLVLTSKETTVDTSKLTSGLYMVEVETSRGKRVEKLIIE